MTSSSGFTIQDHLAKIMTTLPPHFTPNYIYNRQTYKYLIKMIKEHEPTPDLIYTKTYCNFSHIQSAPAPDQYS